MQSGSQEVKYDMQIFADRIEFCWIHLRGIGTLENSLWGYDGQGIRVWLNALAIEPHSSPDDAPQSVKESVNIPLPFYPLCEFVRLVFSAMLTVPRSCTHGQGNHHRRRSRVGHSEKLAICDVQTRDQRTSLPWSNFRWLRIASF